MLLYRNEEMQGTVDDRKEYDVKELCVYECCIIICCACVWMWMFVTFDFPHRRLDLISGSVLCFVLFVLYMGVDVTTKKGRMAFLFWL